MSTTSDHRAWLDRRELLQERLQDHDLSPDERAELNAELAEVEDILERIREGITRSH